MSTALHCATVLYIRWCVSSNDSLEEDEELKILTHVRFFQKRSKNFLKIIIIPVMDNNYYN